MSRFCVLPARFLTDSRMTSMAHLRVLAAIGQHTDRNGWATVGLRLLGELVGLDGQPLSKSRVSHIISDLVEWGYLEKTARSRNSDGGQTSNLYRVLHDVGAPISEGNDTPPVASDATPVASHGAQPPVASHGAQPHKNDNFSNNKNKTPLTPQGEDISLSEPTKQTKPKRDKPALVAPALPDWINQEAWAGFVAMRNKIRKPLTDFAAELLIGELAKFRAEGYDPNETLNRSTMNCWQGVFRPHGVDRSTQQQSTTSQPEARNAVSRI